MKKILLSLFFLLACIATEAKVIKVTLADGSVKVFTSSELSAIDFNEDGTIVITTYDGQQLPAMEADFAELTISEETTVTAVYTDTLRFKIDADGIPVDLHSERPITKVNYVYPSVDPQGQPIMLSGTILIPENIWKKDVRSEGILMVNHYTKFHRDEAPTISNGELENMLLANPLNPNYIIVESDFYGFGVTVRFPQAFMQGLVNARSSLDGLLAAREVLADLNISSGPLCFNIGYSSGGFDALAAQKLRDMEYADRISFDKTFSGGGPSDVREAYRQYVLIDSTAYNAVPLLLMVCTNETQQLNIDYSEVFQPYISDKIDKLILSKNYSSWPVCDSIGREKKVHEILADVYCDLSSPESMAIQNLLEGFNLNNDDWTPDPTQRIYLFHSRGDDYVPIESARPMIPFFKSKGFQPSIIPGKTNLQTNFLVTNMGHLSATFIYYIQTLAAIKAWPLMYTDGQLNPLYQYIINQEQDPVAIMSQLDAMGIDCRAIIKAIVAKMSNSEGGEDSSIDMQSLMMMLQEQLDKMGLTMQDVLEMSEDSGVDVYKLLIDLVTYFTETPATEEEELADETEQSSETKAPMRRAASLLNALDTPTTPAERNEQMLREWMGEYLK
ncbi:MAG: hypothetical protein IJ665_08625 [Phocaeicola sp.]|nr:hypothetical protein [Phocaeicola sp.]